MTGDNKVRIKWIIKDKGEKSGFKNQEYIQTII